MELISELEQGIRLPKPHLCPTPIAEIMSQCFMANPSDRPSFEDLKCMIQLAFNQLKETPATSNDIESMSEIGLQYADLQFKEMYVDMRRRNRQIQQQNLGSTNEDQRNDSISIFVNPTFEIEQRIETEIESEYIEINNDNGLLNTDGAITPKESKLYLGDLTNLISPKYLHTPVSFDQKRPVSFGGGDPTTVLQPDVITKKLVPAKSYPCYQNPSYLMMLSDV